MIRKDDQWRTSSYSAGNGNCVEVADGVGASAVRDSQNRGVGVLTFGTSEWRAFLEAVRRDAF
ncbi:DUF397 domain-containing protein [Nocardiopsis sediminis]|uniref:DUF397 domain-containing protein n=1 Tax=Nocardiopsis sediminis TaxID=1778267 RepID=A0ABV8FT01_9ACTN